MIPTVRNLARIALVFKVDISIFFRNKEANCFRVSKWQDRVRLPIGDKGSPFMYSESMSCLIPDRSVVPCIAELLPMKDDTGFEPKIYRGIEFCFGFGWHRSGFGWQPFGDMRERRRALCGQRDETALSVRREDCVADHGYFVQLVGLRFALRGCAQDSKCRDESGHHERDADQHPVIEIPEGHEHGAAYDDAGNGPPWHAAHAEQGEGLEREAQYSEFAQCGGHQERSVGRGHALKGGDGAGGELRVNVAEAAVEGCPHSKDAAEKYGAGDGDEERDATQQRTLYAAEAYRSA